MALTRMSQLMESTTIATSVASSTEILYGEYTSGELYPTGASLTTLTWHAAPNAGGTYLPAYTAAGAAITQTVAQAQSHPIPADLSGCVAIKAVGNAAATMDVNLKG